MILSGFCFNGISCVALSSATPIIAQHFNGGGQGAFLAQLVLVAPAFSVIFGAPLAGPLSRIIGPRRLVLGSLLIYCLAGTFGFLKPGIGAFILSRLLLGLAGSFLATLSAARAAELAPESGSRLIGFASALASVGAISAVVIAGWLAGKFGWQVACLVYLWPLPLLPALLTMSTKAFAGETHADAGVFTPLAPAIPIFLLTFLLALMLFAPTIEGPFLLAARGMDHPSIIGLVIGSTGLIAAGTAASYGALAARLRFDQQITLVFALFLIPAITIVSARGLTQTEAGLVITGFASGLVSPLVVAMLIRRVDARHIATAIGLYSSTLFASQLLDPFLFKFLIGLLRINPFSAIAAVCCAGVAVSFLYGMRIAKQMARLAPPY